MDLSGIEPLSKIHTLYNCLRCFKNNNQECSKMTVVFEPHQLLLTPHCFLVAVKPPFYIQSCCLFLICGDYVTNRAQLYISKPCRKPFQALKGGRLPPRPQGNNQVCSSQSHASEIDFTPLFYSHFGMYSSGRRGKVGLPVFYLYQLYSLHGF